MAQIMSMLATFGVDLKDFFSGFPLPASNDGNLSCKVVSGMGCYFLVVTVLADMNGFNTFIVNINIVL